MNGIQVLLLAWSAGLVLARRGDTIVVKGADQSTLSPELLACLRENKSALLAILTDQSQKEAT
jgi:hypothetical protein